MTDQELIAELNDMVRLEYIKSWKHVNGRWVIDYYDEWNERDESVPFTKPQVLAFIAGFSCGQGWVRKIARQVDAEKGTTTVADAEYEVREQRDGTCAECGESCKDEDGYHYGNGCPWAGKLWDSVPKQEVSVS